MNVVVCVKQVPDPNAAGQLDPSTHNLVREGVEVVLDPGDEWGIEAGLQIAEATGGSVTVVCMGPDSGIDAIRKAMGMGAEKGIHISDEALAGSDALTTARVLAAAIGREGFDVVVTATESTDGYTGVVAQAIAEFLGVPAATFIKAGEVSGDTLRLRRQTEVGYDQVEVTAPVVLSVTAGYNGLDNPRYTQLRNIMKSKSKPVDRPSLADLGLDGAGGATAQQAVTAVEPAEERQAGEIVEDPEEGVQRVVRFLQDAKVI